ncbi:LysR family transcriptional regulator [Oceaniglobus roseus]|uniref:LysR family transcriptional regulator n=1 Tax=Oceaniglobus roseus TaxID=1737570 RepID=UPI001FE5AF94|nr:LysR family transcriptional regulator [Kandeliimicrobium roseum]
MANTDDLPLDDLAVFLAVAETGGFRAAAKRLNRAPSTISDTVARVEARLGTPLLTRSTRAVRPTEAGQALAARLAPLMTEARIALEDAATAAGAVRGPLRLNVPKAGMLDILPPLIDRFLDRYPEVTVEILVEDRFVDTIAAGCHAGIRYDESLEPDVIAVPIGPRRQQAPWPPRPPISTAAARRVIPAR